MNEAYSLGPEVIGLEFLHNLLLGKAVFDNHYGVACLFPYNGVFPQIGDLVCPF